MPNSYHSSARIAVSFTLSLRWARLDSGIVLMLRELLILAWKLSSLDPENALNFWIPLRLDNLKWGHDGNRPRLSPSYSTSSLSLSSFLPRCNLYVLRWKRGVGQWVSAEPIQISFCGNICVSIFFSWGSSVALHNTNWSASEQQYIKCSLGKFLCI